MCPFRKKWDKYSGVSGFEGGHFGPLKFLPPTDGDIGYAPVFSSLIFSELGKKMTTTYVYSYTIFDNDC